MGLVALALGFCFNRNRRRRSAIKRGKLCVICGGFWCRLALVLAVPAQARPRDDALVRRLPLRRPSPIPGPGWIAITAPPSRCAPRLGMPPALAAQVKLAAVPPAGGAPRDEAARDEVMTGAAGCIRVPGDRPWLDCYYAAAAPMRVQLGLAPPQALTSARPGACASTCCRNSLTRRRPRTAPCRPAAHAAQQWLVEWPVRRCQAHRAQYADAVLQPEQERRFHRHPGRWPGLETEWPKTRSIIPRIGARPASEMLVTISPAAMHTFTMKVEGRRHAL